MLRLLSSARAPLRPLIVIRSAPLLPRPLLTTLTSKASAADVINIEEKADALKVRLTKDEMAALLTELDASKDGILQRDELDVVARAQMERTVTRDILLSAIEKPRSALDRIGSQLVAALDYFGTALFATVGVQIAGCEAGMNIVGCTLVGCIAAMGGGTVNGWLYGAKDGAFWCRDPSFLMVAIAASVFTFYAWPRFCEYAVAAELERCLVSDKAVAALVGQWPPLVGQGRAGAPTVGRVIGGATHGRPRTPRA